jgi:hypothetical protein
VLDELAERLPRRGLIVIISDLFDDPAAIFRGLRHLRYQQHDVIVLQVMDPAEIEFPFSGPTMFCGLEDAGKLLAEPRTLRERYRQEVESFTRRLRVGCRKMNMDFARFNAAEPLDDAISACLATRAASIRKRHARARGGR